MACPRVDVGLDVAFTMCQIQVAKDNLNLVLLYAIVVSKS